MKTFRELIAWELEQEKRRVMSFSNEESAVSQLNSSIRRKLRYLTAAADATRPVVSDRSAT